jgi:hypothetical protein
MTTLGRCPALYSQARGIAIALAAERQTLTAMDRGLMAF